MGVAITGAGDCPLASTCVCIRREHLDIIVVSCYSQHYLRRGMLTGFLEVVTNPWFGDNILGLSWVWLYLVTQMPDIDA